MNTRSGIARNLLHTHTLPFHCTVFAYLLVSMFVVVVLVAVFAVGVGVVFVHVLVVGFGNGLVDRMDSNLVL